MSFHPSARLANKQKNDPQHIFRRLSVLEVEKKVACQARKDALRRIEKIDSKLRELENTIADLLNSLDLCSSSEDDANPNHNKVSPSVTSKGKGFKAKSQPDGNRRFIVRY